MMRMVCKHCGQVLQRKRFGPRLEDLTVFKNRKFCNRTCMAHFMIKDNPSRSAIQRRLKKHRKQSCDLCGSSVNLCMHHKDKDWMNNSEDNLQTLCSSCHTSLHHRNGDIVVTKTKPPCRICGKISYRLNLCPTHLSRFKRHGDPLLVCGKVASN